MSDVSECPRCGSADTVCFGHSMCPGDRTGRCYGFVALEYACLKCRLFYKQIEGDDVLFGVQGRGDDVK